MTAARLQLEIRQAALAGDWLRVEQLLSQLEVLGKARTLDRRVDCICPTTLARKRRATHVQRDDVQIAQNEPSSGQFV